MDTDTEAPTSRAERIAGVIGFISAAAIALICIDLFTGGGLSGLLARARPAGKEAGDDCGC